MSLRRFAFCSLEIIFDTKMYNVYSVYTSLLHRINAMDILFIFFHKIKHPNMIINYFEM